MSSANQNHAISWVVFLVRMLQSGNMKLYERNPKVYLLNQMGSLFFTCGRDTMKEPYLAVPLDFCPFFLQMDWCSASILRKDGYLFLEARNPRTQLLNIALGIRFRPSRLDMFCVKGRENPDDMVLNMKVFEQGEDDPRDVVFPDRHDIVGIPVREISDISELSNEYDDETSRTILDRAGVDQSFTVKRLDFL